MIFNPNLVGMAENGIFGMHLELWRGPKGLSITNDKNIPLASEMRKYKNLYKYNFQIKDIVYIYILLLFAICVDFLIFEIVCNF